MLSQKVAENQLLDVKKVCSAQSERTAIEALKGFGMAPDNSANSIFSGVRLGLDQPFNLANQGRIFDKQGMGGENGAILLADFVRDGLLNLAGFLGSRL